MSLAPRDQWYVVHVLSGQENKVLENIKKRIKSEEMEDVVFEAIIPTERVQEIKRGKKTETTRKFFPGYIIVNMHLLDENNQLVDLSWSNMSGASLDVYRNSTKWTTANDGADTDTVGNGKRATGGTFTYKVCTAGSTTNCSNTATVVF